MKMLLTALLVCLLTCQSQTGASSSSLSVSASRRLFTLDATERADDSISETQLITAALAQMNVTLKCTDDNSTVSVTNHAAKQFEGFIADFFDDMVPLIAKHVVMNTSNMQMKQVHMPLDLQCWCLKCHTAVPPQLRDWDAL